VCWRGARIRGGGLTLLQRTLKAVALYVRSSSKADMLSGDLHVSFVPNADIRVGYSITSSASSSMDCGMFNPSALAVLILTASSNLVGC
jgi:hypothetical protein